MSTQGLHLEGLEKQEISRICVLNKPEILEVHSQKHMYYKWIPPGRILGAEETALVFRVGPSPTNPHVAVWLNSLNQTMWGNETTVMTVV